MTTQEEKENKEARASVQSSIINTINTLYIEIEKSCDIWETKQAKLSMVKKYVEMLKVDVEKTVTKEIKPLIEVTNNMLDVIYECCVAECAEWGKDRDEIPLVYLKRFVDDTTKVFTQSPTKTSLKSGLKDANNKEIKK